MHRKKMIGNVGRNSYCSRVLKQFLGRKTAEAQFLPNHEITEHV